MWNCRIIFNNIISTQLCGIPTFSPTIVVHYFDYDIHVTHIKAFKHHLKIQVMHATRKLFFSDFHSNTQYPLPWLLCEGVDVLQMTWCQMLHFGTWNERIAKHMCFKTLVYNRHFLWQHVFIMYIGGFLHPFCALHGFAEKHTSLHLLPSKIKNWFFFVFHFACFVVA
jgi:hypothetical protein